jgi:hypothetical protein
MKGYEKDVIVGVKGEWRLISLERKESLDNPKRRKGICACLFIPRTK